ncbi:hypothetical protein D9M69_679940 [compost metagenome]
MLLDAAELDQAITALPFDEPTCQPPGWQGAECRRGEGQSVESAEGGRQVQRAGVGLHDSINDQVFAAAVEGDRGAGVRHDVALLQFLLIVEPGQRATNQRPWRRREPRASQHRAFHRRQGGRYRHDLWVEVA